MALRIDPARSHQTTAQTRPETGADNDISAAPVQPEVSEERTPTVPVLDVESEMGTSSVRRSRGTRSAEENPEIVASADGVEDPSKSGFDAQRFQQAEDGSIVLDRGANLVGGSNDGALTEGAQRVGDKRASDDLPKVRLSGTITEGDFGNNRIVEFSYEDVAKGDLRTRAHQLSNEIDRLGADHPDAAAKTKEMNELRDRADKWDPNTEKDRLTFKQALENRIAFWSSPEQMSQAKQMGGFWEKVHTDRLANYQKELERIKDGYTIEGLGDFDH